MAKHKTPILLIALIIAALLFNATAAAWAAPNGRNDGEEDGTQGMQKDEYQRDDEGHITVPQEQQVENLVLFGGSADIAGTVKNEVIAINADLTLRSTAKINDRIIMIGGNLTQENGAAIKEGIYRTDLGGNAINSLLIGGIAFAGLESAKLVALILLVLLAVMINALLPEPIAKIAGLAEPNKGKIAALGVGISIIWVSLSAILVLTRWGISIAALLFFIAAALIFIGFIALSSIVGSKINQRIGWPDAPWSIALSGSLTMSIAAAIPLIGIFISAVIAALSFGISTAYIFHMLHHPASDNNA